MKEEEQKEDEVKEEEVKVKHEKEKEKERRVSLSDAVLQEYEEVQKENKRLHNMITELHKKHHDISIKVINNLKNKNAHQHCVTPCLIL